MKQRYLLACQASGKDIEAFYSAIVSDRKPLSSIAMTPDPTSWRSISFDTAQNARCSGTVAVVAHVTTWDMRSQERRYDLPRTEDEEAWQEE